MSGKKKPAGKQIALCLLLTAAVDGLGVLLVTLLAVKGIVGEDRVPQALGALAFCAAFAGGLPAGTGRLGPGGSLLNAGAFALLLILLCFGGWGEGIAVRGLILLALILLGGLLAGLVGAPFVSGMIDTVLRSLRDEPGYWWHTYRRAWKQNWRQSLVPGALLGLFLGGWGWLLRTMLDGRFAANPSATLWVVAVVSIFICTGFLVWLLVQVPLLDLPLGQLAKNAALMFFGFFPRTLAAALLLLVYWGLTLLYMPYTIPVLLLFSFWLPVSAAVMILYPALDKAFKLEETLAARRDAELDDYMADNDR